MLSDNEFEDWIDRHVRRQPHAINNLALACERHTAKYAQVASDTENYSAAGEGRVKDVNLAKMVAADAQLTKIVNKYYEKKENNQPVECRLGFILDGMICDM